MIDPSCRTRNPPLRGVGRSGVDRVCRSGGIAGDDRRWSGLGPCLACALPGITGSGSDRHQCFVRTCSTVFGNQ